MSTAMVLTPVRHVADPATVRAPRRFDTHSVADVKRAIDQQRAGGCRQLVIDGSDVAFMDHDAADLLVAAGLGCGDGGVRVENPSLAMQITLELLGLASAPMERAA